MVIYKKQKEEGSPLSYGGHDPAYVTYYLELAREQRVWFHLDFFLDEFQISHLRSTCVAVKGDHFAVRCLVEDISRQPLIWGGQAKCYFTVNDGQRIPCDFTSRIVRLYNGPDKSMYIVFSMPEFMSHNQRRDSVRVSLTRESLPDFKVWHGSLSEGGVSKLPVLNWTELEADSCQLVDISATGMRIDVRNTCGIYSRIFPGEQMLLRGDFSRQGKPPYRVFIIGNIMRAVHKQGTADFRSFGIRFQRWQKLDESHSSWFKVDRHGGMDFVAAWVSEKLLKRNHPVES